MKKWPLLLPLILMLAFALTRWPGLMPLNFSAAYGLCFCAGVFLPARFAWVLPLATLIVTDLILDLGYYHYNPINGYALFNYLSFIAIILLGRTFQKCKSWLALLGGGLLSAILFYLITNTGAWLQNPEYAKTVAGWLKALTFGTDGYPHTWEFFRNTLLSGGLFAGLFSAAWKFSPSEKEAEEKEEEESDDRAPEPEESKA